MDVTFEQVRRYLEEDKNIGQNERPSALIHGGKVYPPDLRDRLRFNKQVILIVYELKRNEREIAYRNSVNNIAHSLGIDPNIGSFTFDTKAEVEDILQKLSTYFHVNIDPAEVIHELRGDYREESVFVMFLPILEQPYFI